MWRAIFSSFSYPCTATDALADGILGFNMIPDMFLESILGAVDTLTGIYIIVMATPLEFVVEIAYAGDVMTALIAGVVPAIDAEMLAHETLNGLAAVMTPLEFTSPAP